jgi:hypothetical protein
MINVVSGRAGSFSLPLGPRAEDLPLRLAFTEPPEVATRRASILCWGSPAVPDTASRPRPLAICAGLAEWPRGCGPSTRAVPASRSAAPVQHRAPRASGAADVSGVYQEGSLKAPSNVPRVPGPASTAGGSTKGGSINGYDAGSAAEGFSAGTAILFRISIVDLKRAALLGSERTI